MKHIHYGIQAEALGNSSITLGKGFAMCRLWHRSNDNQSDSKESFAESFLLGTQTSLSKKVGVDQMAVTEALLSAMSP